MNDDDFNKTPELKKHNEGDARFDVTSLDEVKDENGKSILILLVAGVLIYSAYHDALIVETWQLAIWCLCVILSFYSVARKSLATVILNLILFFGVSLIPVWQSAHENFQSVFKLFFG